MGLFGDMGRQFVRLAAAAAAPPRPVFTPTVDPMVRFLGQSLVGRLSVANNLPFDEMWMRFFHLPLRAVALLDSPAGWIALAHHMGVRPSVTVH